MAKKTKRGMELKEDKGRFIKSIGYIISRNGNIAAKRWYLGSVEDDVDAAVSKAIEIRRRWNEGIGVKTVEHNGVQARVWDEAADEPTVASSETQKRASVADKPTVGPSMTVGEAKAMYLGNLKQRLLAGQVSRGHWQSVIAFLKPGLLLLGEDRLLSEIGAADVERAVLTLASRPPSKVDKQPISVKTAKSYIGQMRDFLDEMSKTESAPGSEVALWRKPLRFDDIFRRNQPEKTQAEKNDDIDNDEMGEADAFTVDELTKLYGAASRRQKLWMCIALNCGFTQKEIGDLTLRELKGLNTDTPQIHRARLKTDVVAKWPLWKETAELLREFIKRDERTNPNEAVVLSEEGCELVGWYKTGRNDRVAKSWEYLRNVLPENRQLGFKFLRKTGARHVRLLMPHDVGGDHTAEMYLSHVDSGGGQGQKKTQLGAYSGRDWDRLAKAVHLLREQLQPMFDAEPLHDVLHAAFMGDDAKAARLLAKPKPKANRKAAPRAAGAT